MSKVTGAITGAKRFRNYSCVSREHRSRSAKSEVRAGEHCAMARRPKAAQWSVTNSPPGSPPNARRPPPERCRGPALSNAALCAFDQDDSSDSTSPIRRHSYNHEGMGIRSGALELCAEGREIKSTAPPTRRSSSRKAPARPECQLATSPSAMRALHTQSPTACRAQSSASSSPTFFARR